MIMGGIEEARRREASAHKIQKDFKEKKTQNCSHRYFVVEKMSSNYLEKKSIRICVASP